MTTTLITGADKGLGRETARQLAAAGHIVCAGARDEQRGKEAAAPVGARFVLIDVTSDDSVAAAAAQLRAEAGGLGSFGVATNPDPINAVDPGYTATDLNAHRGTQTIEEGAEITVRMAQFARTAPPAGTSTGTGQFPGDRLPGGHGPW